MNKKNLTLFYCFFLFLQIDLWGEEMDIIGLIRQTNEDVVDLTVPLDLFNSRAFLILRGNADTILDKTIDLLTDKTLSIQEKRILIFVLQKAVRFNRYKYFLNELSICYLNMEIPELIVQQAFFPNEWNFEVIENYKDPIIRTALNNCLQKEDISNVFKKDIEETLNGYALKTIKANRECN
jgi:hypothetical protein